MNSLKRRLEKIESARPAEVDTSLFAADSFFGERDEWPDDPAEQLEQLLFVLAANWPDRMERVFDAMNDPKKICAVTEGLDLENYTGLLELFFRLTEVGPQVDRETIEKVLSKLAAGDVSDTTVSAKWRGGNCESISAAG